MAKNTELTRLAEDAHTAGGFLVIDDDVLLGLELALLEVTSTPQEKREAARHVSFTARQRAVEHIYSGR